MKLKRVKQERRKHNPKVCYYADHWARSGWEVSKGSRKICLRIVHLSTYHGSRGCLPREAKLPARFAQPFCQDGRMGSSRHPTGYKVKEIETHVIQLRWVALRLQLHVAGEILTD